MQSLETTTSTRLQGTDTDHGKLSCIYISTRGRNYEAETQQRRTKKTITRIYHETPSPAQRNEAINTLQQRHETCQRCCESGVEQQCTSCLGTCSPLREDPRVPDVFEGQIQDKCSLTVARTNLSCGVFEREPSPRA